MPPKAKFTKEQIIEAALNIVKTHGFDALTARAAPPGPFSAYVFHATGAIKAFLDHLAYRWMPHRPAPEMFGKRAVVITQCLGLGAKSASRDIKHSLSWWEISKIGTFTTSLLGDIAWEKLPAKKQAKLTKQLQHLAEKFARIDYTKPAHTSLITKLKFLACSMIQKIIHKSHPESLDRRYWAEQGWLDGNRPW